MSISFIALNLKIGLERLEHPRVDTSKTKIELNHGPKTDTIGATLYGFAGEQLTEDLVIAPGYSLPGILLSASQGNVHVE